MRLTDPSDIAVKGGRSLTAEQSRDVTMARNVARYRLTFRAGAEYGELRRFWFVSVVVSHQPAC